MMEYGSINQLKLPKHYYGTT